MRNSSGLLRGDLYVESALLNSGRGGLHVESTIDSYAEVINRFGLRLAAEPPYLLTSRLDMLSIRLRSSAPRFGPCLVDRPGLDLFAGL